jgi:AraC-like DNA-binding protein
MPARRKLVLAFRGQVNRSMIYLEQQPIPQLRPLVRRFWYCRAPQLPHRRERVLPNGCIQIILNLSRNYLIDCPENGTANIRLPRAIVVGARSRFELIDTSDLQELCGIILRPGGFAPLFRERADLFFERSIELQAIWANASVIDKLCQPVPPAKKLSTLQLLLTQLIRQDTSRAPMIDQAFHFFQHNSSSVAECSRSIGISERRLSQVFREQVGLSPKLWCRIRRFQSAAQALYRGADIPWAELALACGYYDQPHFANDFRAFSGIDPTTYSLQKLRWQNHIPVT